MKTKLALAAAIALIFLGGAAAQAQEQGDWLVRAGIWTVAPDSDNGGIVEVDDGYSVGFNGTYFFTDNFAVEVLASLPFSHDVDRKADGTKVGEVKQLPPTVSAQYHFALSESTRVYVGAGVNWTIFFDEDTTGPLTGSDLSLDDSIGLALQLGADFDINQNWFVNVDLRYVDIESDADRDGDFLTTVEIDSWVFGLNVGWHP